MSQSMVAGVVKLTGVGVAMVAGAGAMVAMNADAAEAVSFGAVTALGASVGALVLESLGGEERIEKYIAESAYFDPSDFVAAAAATAALEYGIMGGTGPDFYKIVLVAGIAGGTGPKVAGYLGKLVSGSKAPQAAAQVVP